MQQNSATSNATVIMDKRSLRMPREDRLGGLGGGGGSKAAPFRLVSEHRRRIGAASTGSAAWFKYRFPVNGQSTRSRRTVNGKSTGGPRESRPTVLRERCKGAHCAAHRGLLSLQSVGPMGPQCRGHNLKYRQLSAAINHRPRSRRSPGGAPSDLVVQQAGVSRARWTRQSAAWKGSVNLGHRQV